MIKAKPEGSKPYVVEFFKTHFEYNKSCHIKIETKHRHVFIMYSLCITCYDKTLPCCLPFASPSLYS